MDIENLKKQLEEIAAIIDSAIKEAAGERAGFTLMIYSDDGTMCIGNLSEKKMIKKIKSTLHIMEDIENTMLDIPVGKGH